MSYYAYLLRQYLGLLTGLLDWLSPDAPELPAENRNATETGQERSSVLRIRELAEQVKVLEGERDALSQRVAVAEARVEEKSAEIERLLGLLTAR